MLNPVINLISSVISLINLALLVWVVLGLLIHFDIVNRYNPLIQRVYAALGQMMEPLLRPFRRFTAKYLSAIGVDISPILLLLVLHFIDDAMYSWFYSI